MRSLPTSLFHTGRLATAAAALMAVSLIAVPASATDPETAAPVAAAQDPGAEPFTYETMLGLNRLSDPQVSPDGHWLTYQVREVDTVTGGGTTTLWLQDLTGEIEPGALLSPSGQGNTARWGPDSGTIYFLSSRSGSNQVWATTNAASYQVQVTDLPFDVQGYKVSPDGDRLVVALAVYPDCETLACSLERSEA